MAAMHASADANQLRVQRPRTVHGGHLFAASVKSSTAVHAITCHATHGAPGLKAYSTRFAEHSAPETTAERSRACSRMCSRVHAGCDVATDARASVLDSSTEDCGNCLARLVASTGRSIHR